MSNSKRLVTIAPDNLILGTIDRLRAITGQERASAIESILMTWCIETIESKALPKLEEIAAKASARLPYSEN